MEVARRASATLDREDPREFHRVGLQVARLVAAMHDAIAVAKQDRRAVRVVDSLADHRVQVILEASAGQEVLPDSRGQRRRVQRGIARRRTRLRRRFLQRFLQRQPHNLRVLQHP